MSQPTDPAPAHERATASNGHVQPQAQQQLQRQREGSPIDPHRLEHISVHNPRRILFLYGSQTGCAQDVAENAAREARRMHFSAAVSAMDDYDRVRKQVYNTAVLRKGIEL